MKKKTLLLFSSIFFILLIFPVNLVFNVHAEEVLPGSSWIQNEDILFYRDGCGGCAKIDKYIKDHDLELSFDKKEISKPENAQEFNQICDAMGIDLMDRKVPYLHVDGKCYIGEDQIISYLETCKTEGNQDKTGEQCTEEMKEKNRLPILMLIGAALVDAINPCAFAILLILMSTVLASGARKRALFSGFAFSFSIFISYLLMGLGLYSVVASFEVSTIFVKAIGVLAIIIGLFNLKDFFWYGKGFLMEVPVSWRPKMKSLIKSITSPFGAFLIGFLVSLFLLPCTSGPYIVIISMLGQKETYWSAFLLLVFYNLIFVLPMLLITIAAYFGMNLKEADKKRQANLKLLHLIAGVIMLAMGIAIFIYY